MAVVYSRHKPASYEPMGIPAHAYGDMTDIQPHAHAHTHTHPYHADMDVSEMDGYDGEEDDVEHKYDENKENEPPTSGGYHFKRYVTPTSPLLVTCAVRCSMSVCAALRCALMRCSDVLLWWCCSSLSVLQREGETELDYKAMTEIKPTRRNKQYHNDIQRVGDR